MESNILGFRMGFLINNLFYCNFVRCSTTDQPTKSKSSFIFDQQLKEIKMCFCTNKEMEICTNTKCQYVDIETIKKRLKVKDEKASKYYDYLYEEVSSLTIRRM